MGMDGRKDEGEKDGVLSLLAPFCSSFDVIGCVIAALYQEHELMLLAEWEWEVRYVGRRAHKQPGKQASDRIKKTYKNIYIMQTSSKRQEKKRGERKSKV